MEEQHTDYDQLSAMHQVSIQEQRSHLAELSQSIPSDSPLSSFMSELQDFVGTVLYDMTVKGEQRDWRGIVTSGLRYLSDADRRRFVLENLLESAKNGQDFRSTVERYRKLGLTNVALPPAPVPEQDTWPNESGTVLSRLLTYLKSLTLGLLHLVTNAFKGLTIKGVIPIIGATGGVPHLSFELEVESAVELADFFRLLRPTP